MQEMGDGVDTMCLSSEYPPNGWTRVQRRKIERGGGARKPLKMWKVDK